mmetsp:Transcript_157901/g.506434  ORF Transcript_157901/g.506434 Transcript_157901/m.506434 type:complete len:80 (+) Transcript_157901:542-781(+)
MGPLWRQIGPTLRNASRKFACRTQYLLLDLYFACTPLLRKPECHWHKFCGTQTAAFIWAPLLVGHLTTFHDAERGRDTV